jgi:hypothetical protein
MRSQSCIHGFLRFSIQIVAFLILFLFFCSFVFYCLEQEEEEETGGSRLNQRKERKKKKKKKGEVDSDEEEEVDGVDGLKNKMHKGTPEVRYLVQRTASKILIVLLSLNASPLSRI